MKRMLISGGNGFLGSHLAEKALSNGFEVTIIDDLSTSTGVNVPSEVIFKKTKVEDYSDPTRYDYVVHLAARPSPEDYISNPVSTLMSNSVGTMKMLEIARKSNAVFLYASSSEIYGDSRVIPTPESYFGYVNPSGIRSCYDEGKRFSEALIMAYFRQFGLNTRIQRPFNVYGPRIREDGLYGRVIPRFIDQAIKGKPITVHGDGKQTRSFLFIEDWLEATWKLLTSEGLNGSILNIGSKEEITIVDLAFLIKDMTKSDSQIIFVDSREEDPKRRAADIELAKKLIVWVPRYNIKDGLVPTIDWLRGRAQ